MRIFKSIVCLLCLSVFCISQFQLCPCPPPPAQSWALHNLEIWWLIPHYRAKGFSQMCTTYESKPKGKGGMGTAEINSYIAGENWQAFGIWHAPMDRKFNINILSVWLMHVFRLQGRVFLISQLSSPWGWGIWCHVNEKCENPLGLPIPHAGAYHWHVHNMDNVHHNVTLGKKANSVIHFWCKPDYHYNVCGENQSPWVFTELYTNTGNLFIFFMI